MDLCGQSKSLLFNILPRLVITFLPRSQCLLISWLQSPSAVILEARKINRTEYYFDSFPEENTTLSEEFFVTQAGTFTAPVITVESLYAPHYRANDAFHGVLAVE